MRLEPGHCPACHYLSTACRFPAGRAVEEDPDCEVVGEVFKAVDLAGGDEQERAGVDGAVVVEGPFEDVLQVASSGGPECIRSHFSSSRSPRRMLPPNDGRHRTEGGRQGGGG